MHSASHCTPRERVLNRNALAACGTRTPSRPELRGVSLLGTTGWIVSSTYPLRPALHGAVAPLQMSYGKFSRAFPSRQIKRQESAAFAAISRRRPAGRFHATALGRPCCREATSRPVSHGGNTGRALWTPRTSPRNCFAGWCLRHREARPSGRRCSFSATRPHRSDGPPAGDVPLRQHCRRAVRTALAASDEARKHFPGARRTLWHARCICGSLTGDHTGEQDGRAVCLHTHRCHRVAPRLCRAPGLTSRGKAAWAPPVMGGARPGRCWRSASAPLRNAAWAEARIARSSGEGRR